jgi:hypothetical protein
MKADGGNNDPTDHLAVELSAASRTSELPENASRRTSVIAPETITTLLGMLSIPADPGETATISSVKPDPTPNDYIPRP